MDDNCQSCKIFSPSLFFDGDQWICRRCYIVPEAASMPYIKEVGIENPYDPKGSTAHVRDIKNRRFDTKTKKMFYHENPKSYFFPKG